MSRVPPPTTNTLGQWCIFWRKISIFLGGLSYVTYTFRRKLWGVRDWNCHFIAVLRRNLEKNSVSYQKSLTFPKIEQFWLIFPRGGGVSPNLSEYAPLPQAIQLTDRWTYRQNKSRCRWSVYGLQKHFPQQNIRNSDFKKYRWDSPQIII